MNSIDLETFREAIEIAQAGNKAVARSMLTRLRFSYPQDPSLLIWVAFTAEDPAEAKRVLEMVARIDPNYASLASARIWLAEQEQLQPQSRSASPDYFPTELVNNQPEPLVEISTLSPAWQKRLGRWLKPDEVLLWIGHPNWRIIRRVRDLFEFFLALVSVIVLLLTIFGLIHFYFGLLVVVSFTLVYCLAKFSLFFIRAFGKTCILTDQRVLLIKNRLFQPALIQVLELTEVISVKRVQVWGNNGDLFFFTKVHNGVRKFYIEGVRNDLESTFLRFDIIPRVREVERLVLQVLAKKSGQPPSYTLPKVSGLADKLQEQIGAELGVGEQLVWFGQYNRPLTDNPTGNPLLADDTLLERFILILMVGPMLLAILFSMGNEKIALRLFMSILKLFGKTGYHLLYCLTNRRLILFKGNSVSSYCRIDPTGLIPLDKGDGTGDLVFAEEIASYHDLSSTSIDYKLIDIRVTGGYIEMCHLVELIKVIFGNYQA